MRSLACTSVWLLLMGINAMQAELHDDMIRQCQDTMAAPAWEPEDWQWRPMVVPGLPLLSAPTAAAAVGAADAPGGVLSSAPGSGLQGQQQGSTPREATDDNTARRTTQQGNMQQGIIHVDNVLQPTVQQPTIQQQQQQRPSEQHDNHQDPSRPSRREEDVLNRGLLVPYLNALADLELCRQALEVARDVNRLMAYEQALRVALEQQPGTTLGEIGECAKVCLCMHILVP